MNILITKIEFKLKQKAFSIIFKGFLLVRYKRIADTNYIILNLSLMVTIIYWYNSKAIDKLQNQNIGHIWIKFKNKISP